ncbi:MAG TPA: chemotaxis protein CheW [Candidatus Acidoferrales bacterium]
MNADVPNRRLVVRAGGHHCVLALPDVHETMRPLAIEPVEGAPDGVRGLAVIRGVPVPVVDLAAVLGCHCGQPWSRFVSVRAGRRTVALAVEAVVGIREFDASTLNQMPPLMQSANPEIIASVGALDAELFLVLKTARLLREEIGAPGKGG